MEIQEMAKGATRKTRQPVPRRIRKRVPRARRLFLAGFPGGVEGLMEGNSGLGRTTTMAGWDGLTGGGVPPPPLWASGHDGSEEPPGEAEVAGQKVHLNTQLTGDVLEKAVSIA